MEQRIIKFKAKRLSDNKWVEGDLLHKGKKTYIHFPHINEKGFWVENEQVDPSTVCQFTGQKDKDGKEIWEGDILFRDGQIKKEVKFHKGSFCLACMPLRNLIHYPFDVVQNYVSLGSKFDRKEGEV